jgi:hypothetical protein
MNGQNIFQKKGRSDIVGYSGMAEKKRQCGSVKSVKAKIE